MLLHSCINEVRGNDSLAASLQLMTRLDALLKQPSHASPSNADAAPPAAPQQQSAGPQGVSAADAQVPRSVASDKGSPAPSRDAGVPSPRRSDALNAPRAPDATAAGGDRHTGGRAAATLEITAGRLQEEYDGDAVSEGRSIACVGAALRLSQLLPAIGIDDLAAALKAMSATAIEAAQAGEFIVLFEAPGAALRAFQVLPGWLQRAGSGRAQVAYATGSSIDGGVLSIYPRRRRHLPARRQARSHHPDMCI